MSGEDLFKFNSGKEFRFSNFREIKEENLKGADEKIKKLFNIFAGDDKILQANEAQSLFNALKSAAGDNKTLETDEIKMFAEEKIGEEVIQKWGMIDTQGREILPAIYDNISRIKYGSTTIYANKDHRCIKFDIENLTKKFGIYNNSESK